MTYVTAVVLQAVANGYSYGFDIIDVTGLPSGTVYPILRRLERNGFLRSKWEDEESARDALRPKRKYYEIRGLAGEVLEAARRRFRGLDQPPGGPKSDPVPRPTTG